MKQKSRNGRKRNTPKSILRLLDLEVAKSAVLNSLSCPTLSAATGTLLEAAEKGEVPLADARGSETRSHVCRHLPSRDREGAVANSLFQ